MHGIINKKLIIFSPLLIEKYSFRKCLEKDIHINLAIIRPFFFIWELAHSFFTIAKNFILGNWLLPINLILPINLMIFHTEQYYEIFQGKGHIFREVFKTKNKEYQKLWVGGAVCVNYRKVKNIELSAFLLSFPKFLLIKYPINAQN